MVFILASLEGTPTRGRFLQSCLLSLVDTYLDQGRSILKRGPSFRPLASMRRMQELRSSNLRNKRRKQPHLEPIRGAPPQRGTLTVAEVDYIHFWLWLETLPSIDFHQDWCCQAGVGGPSRFCGTFLYMAPSLRASLSSTTERPFEHSLGEMGFGSSNQVESRSYMAKGGHFSQNINSTVMSLYNNNEANCNQARAWHKW
ncbi:hypothetical protein VNO77_19480 [Canavalia gladiata]|uniref:Uncharacterized protein n=1 Tax=Canavalia gladiata TaxID=3824 RepID=A0AAN9LNF9_CANGL